MRYAHGCILTVERFYTDVLKTGPSFRPQFVWHEADPLREDARVRQGVAEDRQIRITDPEMRHTLASPQQRHDEGYKRPIAQDLDEPLILAAEVLSANPPDIAGLVPPLIAVELPQLRATSLPLDQGYMGGWISL